MQGMKPLGFVVQLGSARRTGPDHFRAEEAIQAGTGGMEL